MEITPVKKTHGTELSSGFGGGSGPFALEIVLQFLRADIRNNDQSEIWQLGRCRFYITIRSLAQSPSHIRLTGAHPHFSNQDVLQFALGRTHDRERLRGSVRRQRRQFHCPSAVGSSGGGIALASKRNGDVRPRRVPTPDRVGLILLKHHVVANNGG